MGPRTAVLLATLVIGCASSEQGSVADTGTTPEPDSGAGAPARDAGSTRDTSAAPPPDRSAPRPTDVPAPLDVFDVPSPDVPSGFADDDRSAPNDLGPPPTPDAGPPPVDVPPLDVGTDVAPEAGDVVSPMDRTLGSPDDPVLVGAGDIASCLSPFDEQVADVLDRIPGTVFAAGDLAYQSGASWEFLLCYNFSWGRHRARTRPAPGNHEYESSGARPYFEYFGENAGRRGEGWYSYELGRWHIVVLNSNCGEVGGCTMDSPQGRWLRADLAAHPNRCTLSYWHHPRFSSGDHGPSTSVQPFWQALYEAGAEVVVVGHDHHYERFARMNARGDADPAFGVREFLVGTGGIFFYPIPNRAAHSEVRQNNTHGVIRFVLHPESYDWDFVPAADGRFTDRGHEECHGPPPAAAPDGG